MNVHISCRCKIWYTNSVNGNIECMSGKKKILILFILKYHAWYVLIYSQKHDTTKTLHRFWQFLQLVLKTISFILVVTRPCGLFTGPQILYFLINFQPLWSIPVISMFNILFEHHVNISFFAFRFFFVNQISLIILPFES